MNKTINRSKLVFMLFLLVIFACENQKTDNENLAVTKDDGTRLILKKEDLLNGNYHTQHAKLFGKYVSGYNVYVLRAIDLVQSSAMDGGGYFIGIKADPPESPIGYNIELFGNKLLQAPRKTSYCSGSSYSVFIESLNLMYGNKPHVLSKERHEAIRMQELDNGRREDGIKFWGNWNADGYGNNFALVQYSGMGKKVAPVNARPGDFLNISWKNGGGHSVVFLGWYINDNNEKCIVYWSSQKSTNGLGDAIVPVSKIQEVMLVRLSKPENIFTFDVEKQVNTTVKGNLIGW